MNPDTHYTPTENGFSISGSAEIFNRTLYGGHANDNNPERFFTFAGDAPVFMGAISDWTKNGVTLYEKCGVLKSGLSITPGKRYKFYYSKDIDQTSRWFHNSEDIHAEFKNGWMEYELSQMSSWFPDVYVNIETYPLMPEDGYIVHYKISSNQRVHFVAGFGGITGADNIARYEFKEETKRNFSAYDAKGNTVTIGKNRATVKSAEGEIMRVATSFDADFGIGSAQAMSEPYPSTFVVSEPENNDDYVVKICAVIEPGKDLDGYIIAMRNSDEATLDKWLAMENPIEYVKEQIYEKISCIDVSTPENPLDLTINPTVIALDSSWHKDSFHHGACAYHTPFLGWRNWYAPTVLGWGDRVSKTMEMYFSYISRGDIKDEKVWYDDSVIPEGENKFDRRFHILENPVGRLPSSFDSDFTPLYGPYNMQECALDMMLYYIEWTGNMDIAKRHFDDMCSMVEWERRMFDPDETGLYQSMLNTWISDGHNYNGGGCAQSTAYNYRANLVLAKIADKIGRDGEVYRKRAEKIKKALNEKLWLPGEGVIAEYLDVLGNKQIHPSVELPTIYHVMDSEMIDDFRAYRTLKFSENHIKNIKTVGRGGRLCYSSNWLPKQYSSCGLFPQENAHLALVYFKLGLKKEGKKILDGISDCYFTGRTPGMAPHIQSNRGTSDFGDLDFTDVSSTYLRLIVEGLFGIRINNLDDVVHIEPGFPDEWEHASLNLKDISLTYTRKGNQEIFNICCDKEEKKLIRVPMRSTKIEAVLVDGKPVDYKIKSAPNNSFIMIKTDKVGRFTLRVMHGNAPLPEVIGQQSVLCGNKIAFELKGADIKEVIDISEVLYDIKIVGNKVYAKTKDINGDHTLFVRAVNGKYDAWLAADYDIISEETKEEPLEDKPFIPVDMTEYFNCNMNEVHDKPYIHPRPKGFSMGMFQNARHSHNWNQYGRNTTYVDDTFFRTSGGTVVSPSGIPFITPKENENLACISMFDVFPTDITIPLKGKGQELAVLFIASTNWLYAHVENARITVKYKDGTETYEKLVYPFDIDDWLTSALTTKSEIFYFNNFNHATVKKLRIDPTKELECVKFEAIANEIVLGVAGISISR